MSPASDPLVHLTTVPMTLRCLSGQPAFMRESGFEVHVISSPGPELARFAEGEGSVPHAVPMLRRITPLRDLAAVAKIWRILRAIRPAIVDAHTPKAGLLGMIAAWLAAVPVRIYHLHGLPFVTRSGLRRRLLRWSDIIAARCAHQVLCVSHSVRAVAIAEGICRPEKIKVLLGGSINGVDAAGKFKPADPSAREASRKRFAIDSNARVLGFIGRVVRDKGIVELVTAWRLLRTEFPDLHCLVVGPFESEDPVPEEIERVLKTDPRIHLVGLDWDTPRLYAAMDLVVLPTYREGFPVVPIEAASMALPVIATRVPGAMDAVEDGVTGTLVAPRDSRVLADAIRHYLRDPVLRRLHGDAGRARVLKEFRQEEFWGAMRDEYRSLMMSRLSLPQPRGANVSAGSGSSL
jgi:glycosyltransferase involved in cell wall biosynthesis